MATTRRRADEGGPDDADPRRRQTILISIAAAAVVLIGAGGWYLSRTTEPSAAAFCDRLHGIADIDEVLTGSAEEIAAGHRDLVAAVAVAPPEIAADAQVVSDAVGLLAERAQVDPQDPQAGVDAGLVELQPHLVTVTTASQAVGAWSEATCGLHLEGTVSEEPGPSTTAPPPPAEAEQAAASDG